MLFFAPLLAFWSFPKKKCRRKKNSQDFTKGLSGLPKDVCSTGPAVLHHQPEVAGRTETTLHPAVSIAQCTAQCLPQISMGSPPRAKPSWSFFWREVITLPLTRPFPLLGRGGVIWFKPTLPEKLQAPSQMFGNTSTAWPNTT